MEKSLTERYGKKMTGMKKVDAWAVTLNGEDEQDSLVAGKLRKVSLLHVGQYFFLI